MHGLLAASCIMHHTGKYIYYELHSKRSCDVYGTIYTLTNHVNITYCVTEREAKKMPFKK